MIIDDVSDDQIYNYYMKMVNCGWTKNQTVMDETRSNIHDLFTNASIC